jgi:hypothetical protein
MLMPLSPRKLSWAAYCDTCFVGSLVIACDQPERTRSFAIEKLRLFGWTHTPPRELAGRENSSAESEWRGETFCVECSRAMQRARAS